MNSRERILDALENRQPDKVPVDLGASPSSANSANPCGNLKFNP